MSDYINKGQKKIIEECDKELKMKEEARKQELKERRKYFEERDKHLLEQQAENNKLFCQTLLNIHHTTNMIINDRYYYNLSPLLTYVK